MNRTNPLHAATTFFATLLLIILYPDVTLAETASFLSPASQTASDQKAHLIWVTSITLIAIIPVLVFLPFILIKYRRRNKSADYQPNWDFSLPLEILMWGVPFLLVGIMSWQLWKSTHKLDPYLPIASANPAINVQVVGLDWKWLFIYPELGIATVGEMAIPVDHPVAMTLTTDTVMQSFIIAALAGQIYAMPGMTTKLHMMAEKTGMFEGENTQYNGDGFAKQKFQTQVLTPDAFDAWVKKVHTNSIELNKKSYDLLAVQSTKSEAHTTLATDAMPENVVYFTLPDTDFFHKIVSRYHDGKPLSVDQQPGTAAFSANPGTELAQ